MDLSNMFSDLAHISNSGYREQLYTDPGILQGIEFLQNENKVKKQVEKNLNLNLISDSHGTGSTTVHLAGLLSNNGTMEEAEEEQDLEEETEEVVSVETETKEEEDDDEEELIEIEIDDVTYCTNNEENGIIYELDKEGNVGKRLGCLKEGDAYFD